MVIGVATEDLHNGNGEAKKGMICEVLKVWLNNSSNDVYTEVKFRANGLKMITSIYNIKMLEGVNNYDKI